MDKKKKEKGIEYCNCCPHCGETVCSYPLGEDTIRNKVSLRCPHCGTFWYVTTKGEPINETGKKGALEELWKKHIGYKYEKRYIRRCPDCMFWSEEEEGWEREKCPRCGYSWLSWFGAKIEYYTWYSYIISHLFGNCFERKKGVYQKYKRSSLICTRGDGEGGCVRWESTLKPPEKNMK